MPPEAQKVNVASSQKTIKLKKWLAKTRQNTLKRKGLPHEVAKLWAFFGVNVLYTRSIAINAMHVHAIKGNYTKLNNYIYIRLHMQNAQQFPLFVPFFLASQPTFSPVKLGSELLIVLSQPWRRGAAVLWLQVGEDNENSHPDNQRAAFSRPKNGLGFGGSMFGVKNSKRTDSKKGWCGMLVRSMSDIFAHIWLFFTTNVT